MSFQHVHRSKSQTPQSSSSTSQFAPPPFSVQEPKRSPTQEEIENEAFQQNKFEAFGLQLKEQHGTITSIEQERLGVLQAKMDSFWAQRMERVKAQPNILAILIRNAQPAQTPEPKATTPSNPIQAKGYTGSNRPDSSVEQLPNKTGMPDALKAGIENLSGYSLDDVRVHYNSLKPAQLYAHAYTQGADIHVAPGQEEHLPHEAWHTVQQMQGRVKPTIQIKGSQISDDEGLEREADMMGAEVLANMPVKPRLGTQLHRANFPSPVPKPIAQRYVEIAGDQIKDALGYLKEKGMEGNLDDHEKNIADLISVHDSLIKVKDAPSLVREIKRAKTTINLISSILSDGLLSRKELGKKGKKFIGSIDRDISDQMSVNVLDIRGAKDNIEGAISERAISSLTSAHRGSLSVAMEREVDHIREAIKRSDDVSLETSEELEMELEALNSKTPVEVLKLVKKMGKAEEYNSKTIKDNIEELNWRVQNTILAIVPQASKFAQSGERDDDYEAFVKGKIPPGESGFTKLLVPEWFKPYERLIENPQNIALEFVGTVEVSAHFKTRDGDQLVTVNAPAYTEAVKEELRKYKLLATHIVKIL